VVVEREVEGKRRRVVVEVEVDGGSGDDGYGCGCSRLGVLCIANEGDDYLKKRVYS
jgi:hypothetical protein